MADQIAKTTQSLTTAGKMRDTTKMLMQPNANWEEYLTPAPLSIAILGELVFISSNDDFSINKNPPKDGFKYIQYPGSFRACLMQICNSGWHAFNEAHKNMDQIRIHTATVPDYMKEAVKILFRGNDKVLESLLPIQLEQIRDIADECVTLADGVEKKYTNVIQLIQELLEACVNASHFYVEEREKVELKLKETKIREKTSKELNERSKKAMEAMTKQVEEAHDTYNKAMDSMPSGWEMMGMDFVEGITSSVTVVMQGMTNLLSAPMTTGFSAAETVEKTFKGIGDREDENVDIDSKMRIYSKSGEILKYIGSIQEYVSDDEINWTELYDQKKNRTKATYTESQFRRLSTDLKRTSASKLREHALSLCMRGIAICEELEQYKPQKTWDDRKTTDMIEKIKKLNDDALAFDCKSKDKLRIPALSPKPPMMAKSESSGSGKASQRAAENARFRIEQSREQLKQTRDTYEKSVENMEKNQKELTEILVEMQNCKIKEIDFNTTIKMMVKGLDAMGRVKEQWEKMVRFFQMVSNIIKCSLSKTMRNFVETADKTKKLSYDDKLFAKDLLYNQAFQASNIASLVHMISGTYTEVSNKYLMDRVSSLGKLMAMDKEKPEFMQERLMLQNSCQAAQEGILQLVFKNKKEFERKTQERMAKIESGLKAILPAAPPGETERIKEIVQAGFKEEGSGEAEEDYY